MMMMLAGRPASGGASAEAAGVPPLRDPRPARRPARAGTRSVPRLPARRGALLRPERPHQRRLQTRYVRTVSPGPGTGSAQVHWSLRDRAGL